MPTILVGGPFRAAVIAKSADAGTAFGLRITGIDVGGGTIVPAVTAAVLHLRILTICAS